MHAYGALRERLDRGEMVVLDGPVGSELVRRGVRWRSLGLRFDAPAVQAVHADYLAAGADVLRTNTFQLNRRIYQDVFRDQEHMRHIGAPDLDRRVPDLVPRAVQLAQAARADANRPEVPIAGVMSPLEHCFRPDVSPTFDQALPEHREIANLLAEAGVDFLLLESMNSVAEARAAAQAAHATGLPVWISFVVDREGHLLSGEALPEIEAEAVLANCAPPEDILRAVSKHKLNGAYAHIGKFDPPSWKFEFFPQFSGTEAWPPDRYAETARGWGVQIVGGCCGVTPDHIRALKR